MLSSFGKNVRVSIFGGSHEPEIGVNIEGIPKGVNLDIPALLAFLQRRAPGNNKFSTPRKEADVPIFTSGVDSGGVTTGETITAIIKNTNTRSGDYSRLSDVPRPGHADYTARLRYGDDVNMAGGGPFSGRMTAPLCIAGGIAKQLLEKENIFIGAHIYSIQNIKDTPFDAVTISEKQLQEVSALPFPTISENAAKKMKECILSAKTEGDSVGGVVECCGLNIPAGLGGAMYDGIESVMSPIFFGIPAVKAVEFGAGFGAAMMKGSENNDSFYIENNSTSALSVKTRTNHHGGILGGISSGMPIIARVAFKPTPSISKEQDSVSLSDMKNTKLCIGGRHDPCVVLRAVPVVEAAMAIGLLDLLYHK